ncbi:hypothetical protein Tco_1344124 [Tanacetum coccineum]
MHESVKTDVQLQSDKLRDEAQAENKVKAQVKEQVTKILTRSSNESKTSHTVAANLSELELKKILIDKMESNKSIYRSDEQKNLYKALVDAYESEKLILDTYGDTITFKRRRNDEEKDEEPSVGSNRGFKRRRAGKEPESTTEEPMHTAKDQPDEETSQLPGWFQKPAKPPTPDRDWNKTLPDAHGHVQPWLSSLALMEDPRESFNELMDTSLDFSAFVINRLKVDTLTLEFSRSNIRADERIMQESVTKTKTADYATSNRLNIWSLTECGDKCRESSHDVYSKRRIIAVTKLQILEWHNYKHLDWITIRRDGGKLYKFKEGDFNRLHIQDIEDMLLLLVQGKLTNLTVKERLAFIVSLRISDLKRREAYSAYSNLRGFIYQNKDKKNRLMRIDELHKFSDGTLNDVWGALDDRLKGIRMKSNLINVTKPDTTRPDIRKRHPYTPYKDPQGFIYVDDIGRNRLMRTDELYKFSDGTLTRLLSLLEDITKNIDMTYLPKRRWSNLEKKRAHFMIKDINKLLKERRMMRSLEKLVGGRLYRTDLRLLQRTI